MQYSNFALMYGMVLVAIHMGLTREKENPGRVDLLIHTDIDLSEHDIQYSMNNLCL